jgi:fatty-acyl-CoA synthase
MGYLLPLAAAFGGLATILYLVYLSVKDTVFFGKFRNVFELVNMLITLKQHSKKNGKVWSYVDDFERKVDKEADVIQFIFVENDEYISRQALDRRANQIGHWAHSDKVNLKQRDTVAFMLLNRPDYVAFWLGVSKVGVRTALLNTNITGKALIHSVTVAVQDSQTKVLVVDGEIRDQISDEIQELQSQGVRVFYWDEASRIVDTFPTDRPDRALRNQVVERDPFLYIFTSGTTGLPKAGKISHTRFYLGSMPVATFCYLKPGMRMYTCLPLYHSAAGMLGVGGVLRTGGTMVVRYVCIWAGD